MDEEHLNGRHCFPPFRDECSNLEGLIKYVHSVVKEGNCVYCGQHFTTEESVKQHMNDLGHGKLNL